MFGFGSKKLKLVAPLTGTEVALTDVPDPAFATKILGDGVAIDPTGDTVKAPCDGEITALFPACQAVGVKTREGVELLIHLGIDTAELKEESFEGLVKQGDIVKQGQPLIRFDAAKIKAAGKAAVTPFLVTNPDKIKSMTLFPGPYTAGETFIMELGL
ncbi:MAG: PTS glucose transporter subunit IIA [Synergistaceae bacterium]|jgi:glucose-specific phosphotransferase system IIA component|nr:PTS glucose transporter subunit IIA [Synergistaceae bacterium]